MEFREKVLNMHKAKKGKIEIVSKFSIKDSRDLVIAYTPGVAEPCKEIHKNPDSAYDYTSKGNMIAIVSDGSAVLGLGNIGPRAAMPVMEGKAILFKEFANVDAFPICLESQEVDDIVFTIKQIAPSFGGINLEDISAPRCFEIVNRLKEELDIPVFHDDQYGTAIVVLAALINSLKIVGKDFQTISVVINGAGAAGIAVAKLLMLVGARDIIICNSKGILDKNDSSLDWSKKEIAKETNPRNIKGNLREALVKADVFIGVSAGGILGKKDIELMNKDSIILAMANPIPEIWPEEAKEGGARIVGTGRSDFPNQVNNVLAFPGIFRGALDVRAREINEEMILEAAYAIANLVPDDKLNEDNILPKAFDKDVGEKVSKAVSKAAINTGLARI